VEGRATCVPAGDELATTGLFVRCGIARLRAADTREDILAQLELKVARSPEGAEIGFVPSEVPKTRPAPLITCRDARRSIVR